MKRTNYLTVLLIIATTFHSCYNVFEDIDILGLKDGDFVDTSLSFNLVNNDEFEGQIKCSQLKLVEKKQISYNKRDLSVNDIINHFSCFPAYNGSLTHFEMFSYDYLINDTLLLHNKINYLTSYVDSILNDISDYNVFELQWNYCDSTFYTIALYDLSGDLVYDNILFNLITSKDFKHNNAKQKLSRSEIPSNNCYMSDYEEVIFYNRSGMIVANSWVWWEEYGHFASRPYYGTGTDSITVIGTEEYYVHEQLRHGEGSWTLNTYLETINAFQDLSNNCYGLFTCCLWAGPAEYKPVVDYSQLEPGMKCNLSELIIDDRWLGCMTEGFVKMQIIAPPSSIHYFNE